MAEGIDGPQQQPQADLLRQAREGARLETARGRPMRRIVAIPQTEEALGAVGQHFDRRVGTRQPACEPR